MKASEKSPAIEPGNTAFESKSSILIVASSQGEMDILARWLEKDGFVIQRLKSPEELGKNVRQKKPVAAVIDITGFDQRIWKHTQKLSEARIPFIIVAPQRSPTVQRQSLDAGANGVLVKPVRAKELSQHIHTMLGD